jgi:hypothetical protein
VLIGDARFQIGKTRFRIGTARSSLVREGFRHASERFLFGQGRENAELRRGPVRQDEPAEEEARKLVPIGCNGVEEPHVPNRNPSFRNGTSRFLATDQGSPDGRAPYAIEESSPNAE